MAHIGEEFRFNACAFEGGIPGFGEGLLGVLELGDVLGNPEGALDFAIRTAQGQLGGEDPGIILMEALVPFGPGFAFGLADDGLAGVDDPFFVFEGCLGMFRGEEVEVGFADGFFGVIQAECAGHGASDADEAGLEVLEVDGIGHVIDQGAEEVSLVGEGILHTPSFRDVPEHALHPEDAAFGVLDGGFDDLDEAGLAVEAGVFLDGFQRLAGGHHVDVVGLVFFGKVLGEEVGIGFAVEFFQGESEYFAEAFIREDEASLSILAEEVLGEGFDERVIEDF